MFRNTLLALTATIGMIAGNEMTANTAQAQGQFKLGVAGKNGSFGLSIGNYGTGLYGAGYGKGVYGPGYYGSASSYYPPLVVVPTYVQYTVYFRTCAYEPWRAYGSFLSHQQAHDTMNYLRLQGLETYEVVR